MVIRHSLVALTTVTTMGFLTLVDQTIKMEERYAAVPQFSLGSDEMLVLIDRLPFQQQPTGSNRSRRDGLWYSTIQKSYVSFWIENSEYYVRLGDLTCRFIAGQKPMAGFRGYPPNDNAGYPYSADAYKEIAALKDAVVEISIKYGKRRSTFHG